MLKVLCKFKIYLKSSTIQLTISQVISLSLSFFTSLIIANSLGTKKFGEFVFYFSVINIVLLFFRFGYFSSVGVLLVQTSNVRRQSELVGSGFVLALLMGIFYSLFLLSISSFIDSFFNSNIEEYIWETSIFLIFMPLTMYINQVVQSLNYYKPLIFYNIASAFISFIIIIFLWQTDNIKIQYLIFAKIVPMNLIILLVFIFLIDMRFTNLIKNLSIVNLKNKKHGFYLYLGQISDQFIYKSDELMINYFVGSSELGLYKIAQQLTYPFRILAKNYAFSKFKIIANSSFIDKRLQKTLVLISIFSMIGSVIFSYIVINYFYANEYKFAFYIVIILSIAVHFNSIYQLYNNFLNGHSLGYITKKNAIYTGIINLIGNCLLIPFLGALGAAFSFLLAMISYWLFSLKEYTRFIHRSE